MLDTVDRDKLLEIMSREQMKMAIKNSPSDEWFSGWINCCIIWQDIIVKLPNEAENIENKCKNSFMEHSVQFLQRMDSLVAKTLKETTEHLSSTSIELRPLFSKPKTKTRTLEDVVDEVLYCKNCGVYICYPTEHNAKDEYRYCHHCGKLLDWDNVSMSEDYKKLEEVKK